MKRITNFLLGIIVSFILSNSLFAQQAASVIWPCTLESRVDTGNASSPSSAEGIGNVSGSSQLSGNDNWKIRSYSGTAAGTSITYQRWWPNDGVSAISWGSETSEVADRFVEFSLTPNAGYTFSLDSLRIYLLGGGTTNIRANIYYSTDGFITRTQLNPEASTDGIALAQNSASDVMLFSYSPTVQLDDSQTLSLRVYPWYTGSASTSKYLYTYNAGMFGVTENVVPVELTSFTASVINNNVELNWTTATEISNSGFSVERKTNNSNWQEITFIKGNGTTTEVSNYSFSDTPNKTAKLYYRLKQIDFNGTAVYSKTVEVNFGSPSKFSLEQNYPNPFNPSTKIKYSIPALGKMNMQTVKIKVYDLLGNEIVTLLNEEKASGEYEVEFDSGKYNLPSGIYFYSITAGNFNSVKKMTLLK